VGWPAGFNWQFMKLRHLSMPMDFGKSILTAATIYSYSNLNSTGASGFEWG